MGMVPITDKSFCCRLINARSEKFVFTVGPGVEPDVRFVKSGPFGPPIPGGSSFTSRLKPRSIMGRIIGEIVFEFTWSDPFPIVNFLGVGFWNPVVFPDEYVIEFVFC